MKRLIAVCMVTSFLLATSTAAFATSVTLLTGNSSWDQTRDFTSTSNPFGLEGGAASSGAPSTTITWSQPYTFAAPAAPDPVALGYPGGGTITLDTQITSALLTIKAYDVNPPTIWDSDGANDHVYRGPNSSGPWTALGVDLTQSVAAFGQDSTTAITLSNPNTWLLGTTGFNPLVLVETTAGNIDWVKTSELQVTTQYTYTYTYQLPPPPPPPPAPVPAPGAILLASIGAGLISWLRARKAL